MQRHTGPLPELFRNARMTRNFQCFETALGKTRCLSVLLLSSLIFSCHFYISQASPSISQGFSAQAALYCCSGVGGGFDMSQQHSCHVHPNMVAPRLHAEEIRSDDGSDLLCHVYRVAGLSSCVCVAAATEFERQSCAGIFHDCPGSVIRTFYCGF